MSNQRINIIIQEINYWKEHKILPDMYCDFLLALYTKGDNESQTSTNNKVAYHGLATILQLTIQFFILLAIVVVINMQQLSLLFQISFLILSFVGTFWMFKLLRERRDIHFQLSVIIILVELFLITVFISNQFVHIEWFSHMIVLGNFICWFLIGYKFKLKYLQIIAGFLVIFTSFYIFLS